MGQRYGPDGQDYIDDIIARVKRIHNYEHIHLEHLCEMVGYRRSDVIDALDRIEYRRWMYDDDPETANDARYIKAIPSAKTSRGGTLFV